MMSEDRQAFEKAVLETIYDLDAIGIHPHLALSGIHAEVDEFLELNSPEILKARHSHFEIPDASAEDYQECFYEIKPACHILAGIRHLGGARDRPFVHVLFGFSPTADDLNLIKRFAAEQFARFSPQHISLWLRPSSALAQELHQKGLTSRSYTAGRLATILKSPLPVGYHRIDLETLDKAPSGGWYEKAYRDFHSSHPELAPWVLMADSEELQNCADDALLFRVTIDGEPAGLIGGRKEPLLGCPAVYITEFLLIPPFRGQGLAMALQRKFLDLLSSEFDLVWGTIDAKNRASTHTAMKTGRIGIRSEFFVPLNCTSHS
jgi:GNAT superfamily N-acetyltransferase